MSKIDEIRSAMIAAMKAGDKERKAALSFLLSSLKNKAIDKRADLTEEEEGQVILKEIKQLKETIDMTPEDRTDLIEEAVDKIKKIDRERRLYYEGRTDRKWGSIDANAILMNTSLLGIDGAVDALEAIYHKWENR